jgi:DNA-binding NtrC family response regulator
LREHKEDIPLLAAHFLRQTAVRLGLPTPRFTEAHARLLQGYEWPGNVRELQNAAERAVILAQNGALHFNLGNGAMPAQESGRVTELTRSEQPVHSEAEMRKFERANLAAALRQTGWKIHGKNGAAEVLGVKPTTLISRMKKMGLKKPR